MFGAASAFHAGVGLEGDELRQIFAGVEAEVFIADKRRDVGESSAGEKNGGGTEHQVQMLGVRDQRHEDEQGQRVGPPDELCVVPEGREVGDHQVEDQEGDDAGLPGDFPPVSFLNSHMGRTKNRRMKRPAMETATQTAKTAAK